MGQDLEEWAHVENLAYPDDTPTFIIAPPGRSRWRAAGIAEKAKSKGRRLAAVIQNNDDELAQMVDYVFPVVGAVREEFSPLVYHIGADLFSAYLTTALGRKIFQPDTPAF
jgi:glucosamine--fructose-6-phosphate aminotransferase (isomerizing)